MYTDGVVEAVNADKDEFGQNRLEEALRALASSSPQQIIVDLRERLKGFTGITTPSDDTTIIAARVTGVRDSNSDCSADPGRTEHSHRAAGASRLAHTPLSCPPHENLLYLLAGCDTSKESL